MKLPPCIDCERRVAHPNCHATCEEYKGYVIERNEMNARRRADGEFYDYVKKHLRKIEKKRK